MQALRIVMQLVTSFGAPMAADMPALLGACWQMFTARYERTPLANVHGQV